MGVERCIHVNTEVLLNIQINPEKSRKIQKNPENPKKQKKQKFWKNTFLKLFCQTTLP